MSDRCSLCGGACAGANLKPLLDGRLNWLWEQIGRTADRRGDSALTEGAISLLIPNAPDQRAAAAGLIGGRVLKQGQTRRVDLSELTSKVRVRGPMLTPGSVASHALGRRLAVRAADDAARRLIERNLLSEFTEFGMSKLSPQSLDQTWSALRRNGWIARLVGAKEAQQLLRTALEVIAALPVREARADRRRLAADITGNPHALDHGSALAGLVIALLVASGKVKSRQKPRAAWAEVGVDCDDILGGLVAVGIAPASWALPLDSIVTLPPRLLAVCDWPLPPPGNPWIFVTENPSVASAASDLAARGTKVHMLCTSGTPSAIEVNAISRLASLGWALAVRADFDAAGLSHVATILNAASQAIPWRMGAVDYAESLKDGLGGEPLSERCPDSPWDTQLSVLMREKGVASYEESLLPLLIEDLRRGYP